MKSEKLLLYILIALLAVFTFLFSLFAINPSLHFHYQQIAWNSGNLFLKYYLTFPGGLGEYFALFISQLFYFKVLGSAIVAFSGALISMFIYKIVLLKWKSFSLLFLLVPLIQIIFLALMFDYRYHFSVTLNLILVSGFLLLCAVIEEKKTGIKINLHTVIFGIIIYYISGGMYFLIFMSSSILLLIKKPDKRMVINLFLCFATALIIPFLAYHFVFLTTLNNCFFRSTPDVAAMLRYSRPVIFYGGLAAIPSILLLTKISSLLPVKRTKSKNRVNKSNKPNPKNPVVFSNNHKYRIEFAAQILVLIIVSGYIIYITYKPSEKTKVEIDYFAYQQNWDKVISMSNQIETYDRMVNFQFNRALLNTGQVLEKLYDYDQLLGSQGLFLDRPFTSEVALPNSDLYFDLGNIDESQRYAFESETLMKNSPRVLKRLVLNCIILDKMNAANTYINILASNPMEKEWVKKYRNYISSPNLADSDSLIMKKRKDMNKTEGLIGTPPLKLISQLEKNPMNKGAFEYLMALDLMEHDLASLEEDFKYIGRLDYKKLPVILEEAVLIFRSQGKGNEFLNRIRISEETSKRFAEFAKLTSASKGDREKAKQATLAFRNTYWYYILFLSPKVTKLSLDTRPVDANY